MITLILIFLTIATLIGTIFYKQTVNELQMNKTRFHSVTAFGGVIIGTLCSFVLTFLISLVL